MPRKPKPPLALEVQGLSAADGAYKHVAYDDFTGEPIEVLEIATAPRQRITRKQRQESKLRKRQEFIQHYIEQRDKALALIMKQREVQYPQAQPVYGIPLGKDYVIAMPRKPWRRL